MAKLTAAGYRFPAPADGVQVNFCKNIRCAAFGVPETLHRIRRPKTTASAPGDYIRAGSLDALRMKCGVCGTKMPIRSNQAVAEERNRLSAYTLDKPAPSCPHEDCDHFGTPVTEPGCYARFGTTKVGTPRWRCNSCKKSFSEEGAPLLRQRKPHKNRDVFLLLVNKAPIRRIAEVTGLDPKSLYGKIKFIGRQCQAFVGERERKLLEGGALPKMYVAVDRQTHNVNWSSRRDRRNVQLSAIASADLASGYVFGFHLNFDPSLDPDAVEREAAALGDLGQAEAYRHFARVWLSPDFEAAVARATESALTKRRGRTKIGGEDAALDAAITSTYAEAGSRADVEAAESATSDTALPALGMLIKEQYTMHGHFQLLARLLAGAEKVRMYLDQDSGIRAAFLGAFADRIKARTADGWYVSVLKDSTIHQKERAVQLAKTRLKEAEERYPGSSKDELLVALMKEEMGLSRTMGQFDDRWLSHPSPSMSEPAKKVCWLTDMGDYDEDHAAALYLKASLHAVDRFFMQARRLLSLAERSLVTASADRRVWHGYSAYRPENLARVLEIFRVYYNYCKAGKDKKTPAMRLGLARAPIPIESILYFG
jgi:transposase-like protein